VHETAADIAAANVGDVMSPIDSKRLVFGVHDGLTVVDMPPVYQGYRIRQRASQYARIFCKMKNGALQGLLEWADKAQSTCRPCFNLQPGINSRHEQAEA